MKTQMKASICCKKTNRQRGVVLLEALVAVLLFSMGVLALVGLQAAMSKNTADARYRSEASFIAQRELAAIWGIDTQANQLARSGVTDISSLLPNGVKTVQVSALPQPPGITGGDAGVLASVVITWQQPGKDSHSYGTSANIVGN
jgi:type IV pilus assembly protein PilV